MKDDKANAALALKAAQTLTTTQWGDNAYHDAHQIVIECLIQDLKNWIKQNPPGSSYKAEEPMRAVYQFEDELHPAFANYAVKNVIRNSLRTLEKTAIQAIRNIVKAPSKNEKKNIESRYPEYSDLLKQIREAKKAWNSEDAVIKKGHNFKMMGGLARLGAHSRSRYDELVTKAQEIEKKILGKTLTKYTRPPR